MQVFLLIELAATLIWKCSVCTCYFYFIQGDLVSLGLSFIMRYKISSLCLLFSGSTVYRHVCEESKAAACLTWSEPNRSEKVILLLIGVLIYCLLKEVMGKRVFLLNL